jgi:molybdopterin synthase sulfur carrier subunit
MEINILAFGQIAEIAGQPAWTMTDIASTDELQDILAKKYPALNGLSYKLAVDKKIVQQNTPLTNNATVAILPAFSGG